MSEPYVVKEGTFSLNKVDQADKKKENSPDFFGDAKLKGVEIRLRGWAKLTDKGKIKITGYIEEKESRDAEKPSESQLNDFLLTPKIASVQNEPGPLDEPGNDLPF